MSPRILAACAALATLPAAAATPEPPPPAPAPAPAPPTPAQPAQPAQPPVALASTDREGIKAAIGKDAVVKGRVTKANNWQGKIVFLDLEGGFTVVCFKKNFPKFPEPPETLYAQKGVEVTGKIREHKGKPQIEITAPDQVKAVPAEPDAAAPPAPAAPAAPAAPPAPAAPASPEAPR